MALFLALCQDPSLADLAKAVENARRPKAYSFVISRRDGSRNRRDGPPDIQGVFAAGVLYLKYGDVEVAQGLFGALARVGGSGDWASVSAARAQLKAMAEPPALELDELLKVPAPHVLVERFQSLVPRPAGRGSAFEGPIAQTAAGRLQDEVWFHLGDDREIMSPVGTGRAEIGGEQRIARLEFSLKGRLLPGSGQGRRPPSRQPPQNPRQGRGYDTPEMTFTVQVAFDKFDKAELPADLAARVGDK
jgi:hypothetical protein